MKKKNSLITVSLYIFKDKLETIVKNTEKEKKILFLLCL